MGLKYKGINLQGNLGLVQLYGTQEYRIEKDFQISQFVLIHIWKET